MRTLVVDGSLNMALVEREMKDAAAGNLPLCPSCAARPAVTTTTGLCRPCHLRELTRRQEDLLAELEAARGFASIRWKVKRARDAQKAAD